ncbi:sugar phosphate isomerase/epimerase family protein [Microbacterium soli]
MIMRPGLCSVTFRRLDPEQIIALAAEAQLEAIEWGGDVHVPAGDVDRAARIARATTDAGLAVCSYGSYFHADPGESITSVLDSAQALGADRVRIWAGRVDSAQAASEEYARIVAVLRDAAAEASDRRIALALEYHRGTVADGPDAVLRLLADVAHPALTTYWQPSVGISDDVVLAEFDAIAAHTSALHVFSWWPQAERRRLHERAAMWQRILDVAAALPVPPRDALLEFLPDDDPALLTVESATLRRWLARS